MAVIYAIAVVVWVACVITFLVEWQRAWPRIAAARAAEGTGRRLPG